MTAFGVSDSRMNALLLYPQFPDTFWSFKHALKFVGKRAALPPLGLLTIAAMLPESWEKRLVDTNVRPLRVQDLKWADIILISAMIAQRESAAKLVARCKQAGKRVVAGGPLFNGKFPEFECIDHFVLNEAEENLPVFVADLEDGQAKRVYNDHVFPSLQLTPSPLWQLIDHRRYATMCVQYSRGCPFDCDFCSVTAMFGKRPRLKTAEQMIRELDELWNTGWRGGVFFVDDNLISNAVALRTELLPALIEWRKRGRGFRYNTEASINLADKDQLMHQMVMAGFEQVFVGIETPEDQSLVECNKHQNLERDLVADVKKIQRCGLEVQGGFIVGFDHDRANIFQRQADFIQQSGIVTAMVGLLQAIPGTKLYERLSNENRIRGDSTGNNVDGSINFVPIMNPELLLEGYRKLIQHLYTPRLYYCRIKTFLREFPPPRFPEKWDVSKIRALFYSILRLGVLGKERFHYWGLLIWTFFRKPKLLSTAITLSVYGFHFRRCCAIKNRH